MFHVEHRHETKADFAQALRDGAKELNLPLPTLLAEQCAHYCRNLIAWNAKTNLTAITDESEIAIKHFIDSLYCQFALDVARGRTLLDVGSGAGFPGLPLKLALPQLDVTLLEPSQKKTAFLRHVIGSLGLTNVQVKSLRVEELPDRDLYSHIITRAVQAEAILSHLTRLVAPSGRIILCRTQSLDQHSIPKGLQLDKEIAYTLPSGQGNRLLSVLTVQS